MALTADDYPQATKDEYGHGFGTLKRIQSALQVSFDQAGVPLPSRQFVAFGDVASQSWDCEQLTVNLVSMYLGQPGSPNVQPARCDLAMSGEFVLQLVRCVPAATIGRAGRAASMKPPEVIDIEASALVQSIDSQLIMETVKGIPSLQGVSVTASATGVESGYQAVIATIHMSLFE